jgi:hypothetical protein
MIKKVIRRKKLSTFSENEDLKYWLSKSPQERIEAVEILRKQYDGNTERLQRVVRIIQLPQR